jgi:protein-tyrosine-phosphatase
MTPTTGELLSSAMQAYLDDATRRLQAEYADDFAPEDIESLVNDSVARLDGHQITSEWIPLLAERFTRNRLRAAKRLGHEDPNQPPAVLFACVHNAGRSQMAAGMMRHLSGDQVVVFSGGSSPSHEINAAAVAAMAEVGIDISAERPHPWTDEIIKASDVIVTMGCGDECPVFPGRQYVDWALEDPKDQPVEKVREIRDQIEERVHRLMAELGVSPVV